jgi:hypothetical protein
MQKNEASKLTGRIHAIISVKSGFSFFIQTLFIFGLILERWILKYDNVLSLFLYFVFVAA